MDRCIIIVRVGFMLRRSYFIDNDLNTWGRGCTDVGWPVLHPAQQVWTWTTSALHPARAACSRHTGPTTPGWEAFTPPPSPPLPSPHPPILLFSLPSALQAGLWSPSSSVSPSKHPRGAPSSFNYSEKSIKYSFSSLIIFCLFFFFFLMLPFYLFLACKIVCVFIFFFIFFCFVFNKHRAPYCRKY